MKTYHSSDHLGWWVGGISAVATVAIFGFVAVSTKTPSYADKTNRELATLCSSNMAETFHIHPNLSIVINDKKEEIPASIGIYGTCMTPLHTHDNTGKLHIEAPEKRDFTLGDFFAVWNKPFDRTQILDYKVDTTHLLQETVNGKEVPDFENTILHDNDQIVITYTEKK